MQSTIRINNVGNKALNWSVYNKPDWVLLSDLQGEIMEAEMQVITVLANMSLGRGDFKDSVEIRSDGGSASVIIRLTVDIDIPQNGIYSGTTAEGLSIEYEINYNKIDNFQCNYYDDDVLKIEWFPIFGNIQYSDSNFFATGLHQFSLTGNYDGIDKIEGNWTIFNGEGELPRDLHYNVSLDN